MQHQPRHLGANCGTARDRSLAILILAVAVSVAGLPRWASAQLTAHTVIGDSVEAIGPRYADVDNAIARFRDRDLSAARELLIQARASDPNLPPADVMLARMEQAVGRTESARRRLESVVVEEPEDPEPYLVFAETALAASRVTAAELLFSRADSRAAALQNAFRKRAIKSRAQGGLAAIAELREDWALAIVHVEAWLEADPNSAAAYQRLGRAQLMFKRVKSAYESFAKARELDASLPIADVAMAQLFEQQGRVADADRFIFRALRTSADDFPTVVAAARWLIGNQQASDALPHLERVLADHPDSIEANYLAGIAARTMRSDELAKKFFDQAHRLSPASVEVNNQLALLLLDGPLREDQQRAVQYAEMNAQLHPENDEAGLTLSWVYYRLGRTAEAEKVLAASLKAGERSADANYFVSKMFYDRGRDAAAANLLREALAARGVFIYRARAQQLLDRIEGKSP